MPADIFIYFFGRGRREEATVCISKFVVRILKFPLANQGL
jgi:hypothetical protein